MAFITLEDVTGSVEVIVFPNSYEQARILINDGNKVFVKGRVQVEEDKDAKLICQDIKSFDDCPQRVWIQLESKAGYEETEKKLAGIIKEMDGKDVLVIYFKQEKEIKVMPANWCLAATSENLAVLKEVFGDDNVRTVAGKVEFAKSKRW